MARLVQADRKAIVTQTTTRYNWGMQKIIFESPTCWTIKQMGCRSKRLHWVLLQSEKDSKLRLQLAQTHQNWTIDWMSLDFCYDIQMVGSEFGINMKAWIHPAMYQHFRLLWCNVWEIYSWHNLCPLIPIGHCLNATACLSIAANHVHPLTTVYLSCDG